MAMVKVICPACQAQVGILNMMLHPRQALPTEAPRLVVHDTKGFVYYTWNHYGDPGGTNLPAFKRIR